MLLRKGREGPCLLPGWTEDRSSKVKCREGVSEEWWWWFLVCCGGSLRWSGLRRKMRIVES